ncbi:MAG: putative peptidoglycan glycosyltransferase FtsW [bacterium]|nr:putative peptidoglycan glycosyltransferase FtsW [bacterium]
MKLLLTNKHGHRPDYVLIAGFFCLVIFGLFALASASSDIGKIRFNNTYYYLENQIVQGIGLGIIGFILGYLIYYKNYKRWALFLLIVNIVLLILVLFSSYGTTLGGSTRWLKIGPIIAQPSEFLKIIFIVYLAAWLSSSKRDSRVKKFGSGFLPFMLISGFIGALLFAQPATSTVFIVLLSALIMYFMSGAKFAYIGLLMVLAITVLGVLIYFTPYRLDRVMAYLTPEADPQGAGFHLRQSLITLGAGGITGVGFGKSTNKYLYLPESIGDSIFAIIGEELGFIGATILVSFIFVVVLRGILISRNMGDEFGKLLLVGFSAILGIQAFVNIAALSGLIPLTGVTLPFISYGSSSLITFMTMAGITVNISRYS